MRQIDWLATARTNEPHVRVHVAERALTTWLLIDRSASMQFGTADRRKADVAEGVALALGHVASRRGNRLGVITSGAGAAASRRPRQGRAGLLAALLALASRRGSRPRARHTALRDGFEHASRVARQRALLVDRQRPARPARLGGAAGTTRRAPRRADDRGARSARGVARGRRRADARRSGDRRSGPRGHPQPPPARALRRGRGRRSGRGRRRACAGPAPITSCSARTASGCAHCWSRSPRARSAAHRDLRLAIHARRPRARADRAGARSARAPSARALRGRLHERERAALGGPARAPVAALPPAGVPARRAQRADRRPRAAPARSLGRAEAGHRHPRNGHLGLDGRRRTSRRPAWAPRRPPPSSSSTGLPRSYRVSLVPFSTNATVAVAPTIRPLQGDCRTLGTPRERRNRDRRCDRARARDRAAVRRAGRASRRSIRTRPRVA